MPRVNNDGISIYWEEQGAGDPLLLIMGLGYTIDMWHRTIPVLAERYRVIYFDNRGVGRSDVPTEPYAMADMATDAVAVLDAAGVEAAHVFGISLGSFIAQELTLTYPERVRSLILAASACGGPEFVPAEPEVYELIATRAHMTPEEGIRVMVPYIYDASTPQERIEEDLAIRLRTYPSPEGYLAQAQVSLGYDSSDRLANIVVPTLVLHGKSDRLIPPDNGEQVARLIPGSKLVTFDKASHVLTTDQPEAVHDAILDFLANVQGAVEASQMGAR